jgi:hypothetical protein
MYEIGVGTNGTVFPEFDDAVTSLADRRRDLFVTVVAQKDDILLSHGLLVGRIGRVAVTCYVLAVYLHRSACVVSEGQDGEVRM